MSDPTQSPSPKVLVADDDAAIVGAIEMLLEDEGYAVVAVTAGDIVEATRLERPNVILLDIWMSGQDGRDVCRRLKGNDATRSIPVIVVSANPSVANLAREAGADDFLAKPFDLDNLLEKVDRHVRRAGSAGHS